VFVLWGRHAQGYHPLIGSKKHFVIRSPHPSPFSARTGFFGSRPFSRTNDYLVSKRQDPVEWRLR
jgi:uracil-DNA glycosylase